MSPAARRALWLAARPFKFVFDWSWLWVRLRLRPRLARLARRSRGIRRLTEALRYSGLSLLDGWDALTGSRTELVPPRRYRHVGRGDFAAIGAEQLELLVQVGGLRPGHALLDVGCGVGRLALPALDYLDGDGSYTGLDVVADWIDWCTGAITARNPRFRFIHANVHNEKYNPDGSVEASSYRFPSAVQSFDLALAFSVFTHMDADEVDNYVGEIARALAPGGTCVATYFLLNDATRAAMAGGEAKAAFVADRSGRHVLDPALPQLGIAHEESWLRDLHARHGLELAPIEYGYWSGRPEAETLAYQDVVVARRPSVDVDDHGKSPWYDSSMEPIAISRFKATCLAVLEDVRRTGEPVLVTKRGEPVAEIVPATRPASGKRRLGALAGSGRVVGDVVSPVVAERDWESLVD